MSSADFEPTPPEAKCYKKNPINWLKWKIYKHPTVFIVFMPAPFAVFHLYHRFKGYFRDMNTGKYCPSVVTNRYLVMRPTEQLVRDTPKRYTN